jgi:SAM-dependent methyltransferase
MLLSEDPISQAVFNYHFHRDNTPVYIHSDGFGADEVLPAYFFRTYQQMPALEQKALELAKGRVLDVGACAGSHSLYLQQKGNQVVALERSGLCCKVLHDRGIPDVRHQDLFQLENEEFDTILLLMNGTGIAGTLDGLGRLFKKLTELLRPDGQILIDSSDLIFLYTDEDGSSVIDLTAEKYYGELVFQTEYQQQKGDEFPWLYVGEDLLAERAERNNLHVRQIFKGKHFDYLAQITF